MRATDVMRIWVAEPGSPGITCATLAQAQRRARRGGGNVVIRYRDGRIGLQMRGRGQLVVEMPTSWPSI